MKARRHEGTEARSESASLRRGFSLIEVLLAVFILSIGVISITALFPAGILQQRQSVDDVTGPIVAQNALAILRTKLRPADFGTIEETFGEISPTIEGDFGWSRPAFFKTDSMVNGVVVPGGSIIIFNDDSLSDLTDGEIPWNFSLYGNIAPRILLTQSERYYPMAPIKATAIRPPKPQYVWDCMFRRFQGKVMVAIFVYRTTMAGGGDVNYSVPVNLSDPDIPPMPISLNITTPEMWADEGPWDADGDQFIWGTRAGEPYDTADQRQSWQEPGQWILDQNNNMHRVLSQVREDLDNDGDPNNDPVLAELVRPVPAISAVPTNFALGVGQPNGFVYEDIVTNIWYIPREVTLGGVPVRLTPVYVTVREL